MKNKAWLALLIVPLLVGCGTKDADPIKPVKVKSVEEQNEEILKNVNIELPEIKTGEYKTQGETGETYSDPNRIQLGDTEDDFLDQVKIQEN